MKKIKKIFLLILTAALFVASAPVYAETKSDSNYDVLVLNFDPVFSMAGNQKQHELMKWWNDPHWLAEEFQADMSEISYGYAGYDVVEWIDIDEMPKSTDGRAYTTEYYYNTLKNASKETNNSYWLYDGWDKYGYTFDYEYYLEKYDVFDRVNNDEIDEVWIFTGPMVGVTLYETRMIGKATYWCNSPQLEYDCKPFVVYGFNYERGVGEMLEDAGHRAESIMNHIIGKPDYTKNYSDYTDWGKFTAYDFVAPGKAGVGNIHFAPNSTADYKWGSSDYVYSNCEDWMNYPNMTAAPEKVNCEVWGNGDIREHHKWWFSRFPHAEGINSETGFNNNWWTYFTLDYINSPPDSAVDGDVNNDGVFNVFDVIEFRKWFLTNDTELKNLKAADLSDDKKINITDFCLMKSKLIDIENTCS